MRKHVVIIFLFLPLLLLAENYPGIGPFTVASGKQLYFAPANLQYCPATDTWRFAPEQYSYLGSDNNSSGPFYAGWIDLFPWGTGLNPTYINHTITGYDTFVDWGINPIDTFAPNTWRTPTKDEIVYLFQHRPRSNQLWGAARVGNYSGLIILPDDWASRGCPVFFQPGQSDYYSNMLSLQEWSLMEEAGAMFWPAAGFLETIPTSNAKSMNAEGFYWTSTTNPQPYTGQINNGTSTVYENITQSHELLFTGNGIYPDYFGFRYRGRSVRLIYNGEVEVVRDTLVSGCDSVLFEGHTYYETTHLDTTMNDTHYNVTITANESVHRSFTRQGNDSVAYGGHTYYNDTTLIERSTTATGCEQVDTIHLFVLKTVVGVLDSLIVNELDWLIVCNNRLLREHYPADSYEYQWLKNGENAYSLYPYPDYYTEDQRLSGIFQLEVLVRRTGQPNVRVLSNIITIAPMVNAPSLFPNPAQRGEGVEVRHDGWFSIAVYDLTGTIVYRTAAEDRVMLPGLSTGIYMVQIEVEEPEIQKLIVK